MALRFKILYLENLALQSYSKNKKDLTVLSGFDTIYCALTKSSISTKLYAILIDFCVLKMNATFKLVHVAISLKFDLKNTERFGKKNNYTSKSTIGRFISKYGL